MPVDPIHGYEVVYGCDFQRWLRAEFVPVEQIPYAGKFAKQQPRSRPTGKKREQKPLLALSHTYIAATQNLKQKRKRDTISHVEEQRLKRCFNAKLEVIHQEGRYGVQVVECREWPGMQPFIIWDEAGNYFAGMSARIRRALYAQPATEQTTLTWDDFCKEVPFPRDNTHTIKANALWFGLNHYIEHDGQKFYPFGDPEAEVTKANGQAGTNGAANRANNAYDKIYEGRHPDYPKPKSAGEMTLF